MKLMKLNLCFVNEKRRTFSFVKSAGPLPAMEAVSEFEEYFHEQIFSSPVQPYKPQACSEFADRDFYACVDCGDRYVLESSLNLHLSRQSVAITYFCKQCDQSLHFDNRCSLLAHLRLHPESNENVLSIHISPLPLNSVTSKNNCSEVSVVESNVQLRTKDTVPIKKSVQITSIKPGEVKVLISEKPNLPNNPVKCRECGTEVESLKLHFLGDNKPFNPQIKCQHCDHILPTKCNLKAHMRIHLKKFPFVCPDCMKEFAFFELFMVHLRYFCFHLEKCARFKCQACPGIFPSLTSLEVHLATRHVKPVFKCFACPRAFFEQKLLNDHKVQSHGDVKIPTKFFEQCQLCPQKLLTKNCLFFHIHEHVMNKNVCFYCYKCSNCKYITDTKLNFASHRLTCPSSEKDANAHALAKLVKNNLAGDYLVNSKKPVAVCHPNVSNSSDQVTSKTQEADKTAIIAHSRTKCSPYSRQGKNWVSSANKLSPIISHQQKIVRQYISLRVQKPCGWYPNKCLFCQNELTLGRQFARYNCPTSYEGCHKWNESETGGNYAQENSCAASKISKSNRKNCMAFNGPSNSSKLPSAECSTYLCHICKHSVQMNHSIIQKHFRQQHPDIELLSLFPLTYKIDLPKLNVPLEYLKFSVRKCKLYQTVTVKAKMPPKKKMDSMERNNLLKLKRSTFQSIVKNWLVCSKCRFKTKNRFTYKKHIKSHKSTPYECPECGLRFVVEPSLKKHFILHHGNAAVNVESVESGTELKADFDDNLNCKVCNKSFDNAGDLQKHFRIHGMAFLLLNKDETVWRKI